jgi:hypothetical protein
VADGAVYQQLRPGYMFGEKVLRPSLVNVATAAGASDVEEPLETANGEADAVPEEIAEEAVEVLAGGGEEIEFDEDGAESRTQDLPIVDVTPDLNARLFEEKVEEEAESASEE